MNHFELLKEYKNPDDKLCLSQVLDKIQFVHKRNQIEVTDFFDMMQISLVESFLKKQKIQNYHFWGGFEEAERKILFLYPENYTQGMLEKNYSKFLKVLRIDFTPPLSTPYEHRVYLSGIIKLGIKREKVGDILVRPNGADIITLSSMENILPKELSSLTRFQSAEISIQELNNLQIQEKTFKQVSIIVPSLRLDNFVSDLAKTSRAKANELITSNLVFLNGKCDWKPSKQVEPGDIITIRRKGKFIFREIQKTTKSGNLVLLIDQYV